MDSLAIGVCGYMIGYSAILYYYTVIRPREKDFFKGLIPIQLICFLFLVVAVVATHS